MDVGRSIRREDQTPSRAVGPRLRALRRANGLTQRQLAERARLSLEAVWTIEAGRKHPRRGTQELLAGALGVPVAELSGAGARDGTDAT